MAFNYKNLNNIGGSTGRVKLFFYSTSDSITVMQTTDYFEPGIKYGINSRDFIIIISTGDNALYIGFIYYVVGRWILFSLLRF